MIWCKVDLARPFVDARDTLDLMTSVAAGDGPTSPWRSAVFRAVWWANLASTFGALIQLVAAAWLMASLGGSSQMIAGVQTAATLPITLVSLWAGAVADHRDQRLIMLWSQVFILGTSCALTASAAFGLLTPWRLLGFTFLIACGTAFKNPAWQASVSDMVPRSAIPAAVALNSMGFNIARGVGPALGGVIVATAGAAGAFALNTVANLGLVFVLHRWAPVRVPRRFPREALGVAVLQGIRYVASSPGLTIVVLRAALFCMGAIASAALMPLIARDLLGGEARLYGLLLGGFGVGAVGGAVLKRRAGGTIPNEFLVGGASLVMAGGAGLAAISGSMVITLVSLALAGAGWVVALSTFNVTVQMLSPRRFAARTLSIYQVASFGGMAAGSAIFGALAELYGVAAALGLSGATLALNAALGLMLRLPSEGLSPVDHTQPETIEG